MSRLRTSTTLTLGVLAILAVIALLVLRSSGPGLAGTPLDGEPAPPFTLQAASRGAVSLAGYRGSAVLVTFGRPCPAPDCAATLRLLDRARDQAGDRRAPVRVLFVATDPSAHLDDLRAFAQDVDLGITALGGDSAALAATAAAYGARLPDSLAVDRTAPAGAFGIDRDGRLRVYWRPGTPVADIARDLRPLRSP